MRQMNNYTKNDLTFVVCAYGECPYLEECISSLINQTARARIILSTSTPNSYIRGLAEKFGLEVRINPKDSGQIANFNFAVRQAETDLVILAHQDEVYLQNFVQRVLDEINMAYRPIIAFTNYLEIHDGIVDAGPSAMCRIKKILLLPLRIRGMGRYRFIKRAIQCFGNPITHSTVVCVRRELPDHIFSEKYKAAPDWDLWERLSKQDGSFVYVNNVLLYHRMNDDSQTSQLLRTTNARYHDEYEIMCRFWPKAAARFIMRFYKKSARYY